MLRLTADARKREKSRKESIKEAHNTRDRERKFTWRDSNRKGSSMYAKGVWTRERSYYKFAAPLCQKRHDEAIK